MLAELLQGNAHRVVLAERRPDGRGNPEATLITVAVECDEPVPLHEWGRETCMESYAGGPFTGLASILDSTGRRITARSPVWGDDSCVWTE